MRHAMYRQLSARSVRIAACAVMLLSLGLPAPVAAQAPLAITTRVLPTAVAGSPYSFTLTATGGTPPYTWSGARQTPDNSLGDMSLDADTGELFGTPAFSGIMPMILDVTDDNGAGATVQFDFVVTGAGSPHSFVNAPPNGTQGTPYDFQFVMSWDVPPFASCGNMSFIGGGLPPGLGINPLMGRMTGTPLVAGEYTFTLSRDGVTTACSGSEPTQTNAQTFTITIAPSGPASSPPGYQALPGSVTIPAGVAKVSITITPVNDALVEGAETVVVKLAVRPGYTLGAPKSAAVTIVSNE